MNILRRRIIVIGVVGLLIKTSIMVGVKALEMPSRENKNNIEIVEVADDEPSQQGEKIEEVAVEEPKQEVKVETTKRVEKVVETEQKQLSASNNGTAYRLTSFYSNDGYGTGSCAGSGLCEKDFQVNDKGWYTYQGKLVLAGATEELLRSGYNVKGGGTRQSGKHYFRYYDTLTLIIDGITYEGIILDSCGASMWQGETRLDIFVQNKASAIDRGYKGKNMITVYYH